MMRSKQEPITVNCLCPGLVPTGLAVKELLDVFPKERLTPLSTIIKAVEGFIDGEGSGQVAECSGLNVHYRDPPSYSDEDAVFLVSGNLFPKITHEVARARN